MYIMNKILTDLKILSNVRENSLTKNLTKTPLKEPNDVMPRVPNFYKSRRRLVSNV